MRKRIDQVQVGEWLVVQGKAMRVDWVGEGRLETHLGMGGQEAFAPPSTMVTVWTTEQVVWSQAVQLPLFSQESVLCG